MIRINKPADPPEVLKTKGKKQRKSMCISYSRCRSEYDSGEKTFKFDRDIYGDKSVKETLKETQHSKCCFCESKITHITHGDVEHFRPKGGYKKEKSDQLNRPGYYWLAYEWGNLYFACEICNRTFKKNFFPIQNEESRAKSHKDDVGLEEPLLIDPGIEKPEDFIGFRKEIAYLINHNKSKHVIEQLNRPDLVERRKQRYDLLELLYVIVKNNPELPQKDDAQAKIDELAQEDAEYTAMVRCAMRDNFGLA